MPSAGTSELPVLEVVPLKKAQKNAVLDIDSYKFLTGAPLRLYSIHRRKFRIELRRIVLEIGKQPEYRPFWRLLV